MDAPPVQYVTTSDGFNIAYTVSGAGQPFIFFPLAYSSVQTVWRHFPDWMKGLASRFRVICFDARGEGLSTRGLPGETSLADYVLDVQAVIQRFKGERFVFFVQGGRGHDAVRFADQNPDRVEAVIWLTAAVNNSAWPSAMFRALPNENWQAFIAAFVPPGLSAEERHRRMQEYGDCMRLDDRNIFTRTHFPSDVENELQRLKAPMLVMHPRDYPWLPVEESMKVTAQVANAQFVSFDGERAVTGDVTPGLAAIDSFLAGLPPWDSHPMALAPSDPLPSDLSAREVEVLRLLAQGRSNPEIAKELFITRNTVQNHVSNILNKINLNNRAQAAAYAQRHNLI